MKRSVKIWIGVAVLLVAGLVTAGFYKSKSREVLQVEVGKVERTDLVSKVTANGKIEAMRKVDLSANIMGQIVNLAVREGDVVKKGDFLLQIDRAQLAASAEGAAAGVKALFHDLDAARASAEEAEQNYARVKKSYDDRIVPQADLDRARSALDSARANVAATEGRIDQARASLAGARDTLSKTTMRAPIDGIVTDLPVEEGEVAVIGTMNNPGTVLMTISDMSVVEAVMDVDETDIPNVKVGQSAKVTIDAYPNQTFDGVVTEVASSPRSRAEAAQSGSSTEAVNFEVKIQLQSPPEAVRPGFSTSAEIITGEKPKSLAIPIQALVVREKKSDAKSTEKVRGEEEGVYLFDRKAEKVKFAPVKTGITGETSIEVVSGVKQGDEIVTGPFKTLRDLDDGKKAKEAKKPEPKKG